MYELAGGNYDKVRPLLDGGVVHPEVAAVLAGNNPGWVFADHEEAPRTALIWSQGMQGFYLIGDRLNWTFLDALDDYVTDSLAPRLRETGVSYFEISAQDEEWDLERIFAAREMQSWEQLVFKLASKPAEAVVPQGLRAMDLRSPQWREADWTGKSFVGNHIGLSGLRRSSLCNKDSAMQPLPVKRSPECATPASLRRIPMLSASRRHRITVDREWERFWQTWLLMIR
nr:hypothetical protein [Paenibacillus tengchongensis]